MSVGGAVEGVGGGVEGAVSWEGETPDLPARTPPVLDQADHSATATAAAAVAAAPAGVVVAGDVVFASAPHQRRDCIDEPLADSGQV